MIRRRAPTGVRPSSLGGDVPRSASSSLWSVNP
jgi:hypothetical protein